MSQQEHLELGESGIIRRDLFVGRFLEKGTGKGQIGIFIKDVVQKREVKECENGQRVMFFKLPRRVEELPEPLIIIDVAKGELFVR